MKLFNDLYDIRRMLVKMGYLQPDDVADEERQTNKCFVCNKELKTDVCDDCKIDFNELFICPFLNDDLLNQKQEKVCEITNKICSLKGLEFESCDKYHENELD